MEPIKKRAALYVRVSTNKQDNSLSAQVDRLKAYCTYNNIDIISIIEDSDVSGGMPIGNRPGGAKIVELIACKEIDCIVGTKIDRLFRSTLDALSTVEIWEKRKISLHLADMGGVSIDTSTANGKLFFTMMASMAEYERGVIAERTKAVLNHKKSNEKVYSSAPFGFNITDRVLDDEGKVMNSGRLTENEDEMRVVKTVFEMSRAGKSIRAISSELNDAGMQTKKKAKFHPTTIAHMLSNDIYKNVKI